LVSLGRRYLFLKQNKKIRQKCCLAPKMLVWGVVDFKNYLVYRNTGREILQKRILPCEKIVNTVDENSGRYLGVLLTRVLDESWNIKGLF
jgi:hypothetical protein